MNKKGKQKIKNLTAFFFEIGSLRKIARSHRQTLLTNDLSDNISSHTYRTTMIGYFLAHELNADITKVITMCLFHDIDEARGGDQNWVNKRYVKVYDNEILANQLKNLPNPKKLKKIMIEYNQRKTREAKIAKDADLLDQILLLKEYTWQGNNEAKDWLKTKDGQNQQEKQMYTQLAKKIVREIRHQRPSYWWNNLWTSKRR